MVVDRRYVFVGSANLDPRSGLLNTEIGIMVDSPALAKKTIALFDKSASLENSYQLQLGQSNKELSWLTRKDGKEITFFQEPEVGFYVNSQSSHQPAACRKPALKTRIPLIYFFLRERKKFCNKVLLSSASTPASTSNT